MNSTIRAVVFDYGNVLLDWNPRYLYRHYFPDDSDGMERFLHEINFMEWNLQQDKGRSFDEGVSVLSNEFPQYAHLIQAYHIRWKDSIGDMIAGTVEILRRLKQAGYPLYGLSNWSAETFPYTREKYDFFEYFDDMVISGEVGYVKPDPEIFGLLLRKIGRPASEYLLIDDSLPNIEQANMMGFVTVHFESSAQLDADLTRLNLFSQP